MTGRLLLLGLSACSGRLPLPLWLPECADDELVDGEACVPAACGTGTWGAIVRDDATIHVDAGAGAGGDGSEAGPLLSIQAAADLAASWGGAKIAVAAGTYVENVHIGDGYAGIGIEGRCREFVTVDGSGRRSSPTMEVTSDSASADIRLAGLTLTGGTSAGLWMEGANVVAEDLDVLANAGGGVVALDGALVTLSGVTVSGSGPDRNDEYGYGLDVESGSHLTANGCIIDGNTALGVFASNSGTLVELTDTTVMNTVATAESTAGYGVSVQEGASFSATGCTIAGNSGIGVGVTGSGSVAVLSDCEVLDTIAEPNATLGHGLDVADGAVLTATECVIGRSAETGVLASGAASVVTLVDSTISDTLPRPDGAYGNGVTIQSGASVFATRSTIERNGAVGVLIQGPGSSGVLDETIIRDTVPALDGAVGYGLQLGDGATLVATGCTITNNAELGVYLWGAGTHAHLVETTIGDTASRSDGIGGRGIGVSDGAMLVAERCSVEGNREVGVLAADSGTIVDLTACSIFDTARSRDTGFGTGLVAQSGAEVSATGLVVTGSDGPGVYVTDDGSITCSSCTLADNAFAGALATNGTLDLTSLTITDRGPDAEFGGGFGLYAISTVGPPTVRLSDSVVAGHAYAAIWLDGNGSYDIERNDLSGGSGVLSDGQLLHGNAVFAENGVGAWTGSAGLLLRDNTLGGSSLAVFLDGSSATLEGNVWTENTTDVWQQRCELTSPLTEADLLGAGTATV